MNAQDRSELASLHALDLLTGVELEQALFLEARDVEFATEVREQREAMSEICENIQPIQPSDLLRERVLALPGKTVSSSPRRVKSWLGWAAAAVLALCGLFLYSKFQAVAAQYAALQEENQQTRAHFDEAQARNAENLREFVYLKSLIKSADDRETAILAENEAADEKNTELLAQIDTLQKNNELAGLRLASLEGQVAEFKNTQAVVVWNQKENKGLIRLTNLPAVEAGKDYQLWIVDPAHENPVDGGLLIANADGNVTVPFTAADKVTEATAFAISIEKKGGVPVAEGPIVFVGK